ncbi:hypothetical protein AWC38_SpisGene19857 [Stylophora pistillata]|uniref:Uncharacterized protein n=1 Tax=Stylophora pistillata TaxID=50429 RepID=A0A2B4RC21_STYPI|nr:hypothetical protein AWC38_SpisGene19857 [Stylophora pistillata]
MATGEEIDKKRARRWTEVRRTREEIKKICRVLEIPKFGKKQSAKTVVQSSFRQPDNTAVGNTSNTSSSNGKDKSNSAVKGTELHSRLQKYIKRRLERKADLALKPDEKEIIKFINDLEERFKFRIIASELQIDGYASHKQSGETHHWNGKIDAIGVGKDDTVIVIDWIRCNDLPNFWQSAAEFSKKLHQAMIYRKKLATHLKHFCEGNNVPEVGIMNVPISSKDIKDSDPRLCTDFTKREKAGFFVKMDNYDWTTQKPSKRGFSISRVQHLTSRQALTLDDVDDLTPIYIACTTVNRWRRTPSPRELHYEVLIMSPHGIERIDRSPDEQELHGKLLPEDIYLSDAAATSNAAVSYDMGVQQSDEAPSRDLKVILGLSAGASIVADQRHENKRHFCVKNLPVLIELIRLVPLALILTLFAKIDQETVLVAGMLIHFGICLIFSLLALVPTGGKNVGRLERLARWFTINVSSIHYYRLMMNTTNIGPKPPPVLSLTDGGHVENLGILPLLKLRLGKIMVVHGGRSIVDKDYGKSLLIALNLAREKLGCSFSAVDGRDISEDIRGNFAERSPGSQPSNYKFKVHYYDKNVNSDGKTKVGEGEILYIVPRHPDKAVKTTPYVTWEEALGDMDEDLEAGL